MELILFAGCLLAQLVSGAEQPAVAVSRLLQQGKPAEARAAAAEALKTRPADAELWGLLGVASARANDLAAAETAFRKAVVLAPRLESAWLNLGRVYQLSPAEGAAAKGIAAYDTVLRLNPASAEAHHQLAVLLQWKGDFRGSLAHLDRLPPADRNRRAAVALRCAGEAGLGHTAAALEAATRLLAEPQLEAGDVLAILPVLEAHDGPVALRLLEGLEERGLSNSQTAAHLAALQEKRGELAKARDAYEKLARQSPAAVEPLLQLARVAWQQKDYEGTLGYLAHARDLEPGNPGIHFLFGLTCNEMHLPVEARKSLEKALALAPDNPFYNYAMGAVQLQWTDKIQAVPYFEKFLAQRPEDARGHLALAAAYFSLYEDEKATAQLALPLRDPQTRLGALYLMGRLAKQQNDLSGAAARFRELLALDAKSPDAHAELGTVLYDQQDYAGARREIDAALALEPDNLLANRTLLQLYGAARDPRVKAQTEHVQKLMQGRDERLRLLQRTIEVRPW
jgi:tetratricopeptide (TPR) repeat protein